MDNKEIVALCYQLSIVANRLYLQDLLVMEKTVRKAIDVLSAAPNAQGAAVPDAYQIINTMAQEFKQGWPDHQGKYDWMIGYAERLKRTTSHPLTTKE